MIRLPGVQFKDGENPALRDRKLRQLAETVERMALPVVPEFPMVGNSRLQAFIFQLTNTGGTLQHLFRRSITGTAPDPRLVALITAPEVTALTNTPTGADASTAFSGGAKLSSAEPSRILFNAAAPIQNIGETASVAVVERNSSTVALTAAIINYNINVNGTTRNWPALTFRNATSGAIYDLTTLGSGLLIMARCHIFLTDPNA